MILRPVVYVQDQDGDQWEAWVQLGLPQITLAIEDKVAGDLGRAKVQKQVPVVLHFLQIGHICRSSSIKPPNLATITAKTQQNRLKM